MPFSEWPTIRPEQLDRAPSRPVPPDCWIEGPLSTANRWLVTTQFGPGDLPDLDPRAFVPLDELPQEDAVALLERYQPGERFADADERKAAHSIARLLGGFTLAVESAAVFLGQFSGTTCTEFLKMLGAEGLAGLEEASSEASRGVRHGEKRLTATLAPTPLLPRSG